MSHIRTTLLILTVIGGLWAVQCVASTGEPANVDANPSPAGAAPGPILELAGSWKGSQGVSDARSHLLIRHAAGWREARARLFGNASDVPPADLGVDFSTHSVVVVYEGMQSIRDGLSAIAYRADQNTVLLRVHAQSYQTKGYTPPTWPYGVFVVATEGGENVVVETDAQGTIGAPAIWVEQDRWVVR